MSNNPNNNAQSRNQAEIKKILAEAEKLSAEALKLRADAAKTLSERFWYPAIALATIVGADAGLAKLLL